MLLFYHFTYITINRSKIDGFLRFTAFSFEALTKEVPYVLGYGHEKQESLGDQMVKIPHTYTVINFDARVTNRQT